MSSLPSDNLMMPGNHYDPAMGYIDPMVKKFLIDLNKC